MIHRITLILAAFCAVVFAQPSLTNNNLDNLTPTAKDNLEALGVLTDDAGPDNTAVNTAIATDPAATRSAAGAFGVAGGTITGDTTIDANLDVTGTFGVDALSTGSLLITGPIEAGELIASSITLTGSAQKIKAASTAYTTDTYTNDPDLAVAIPGAGTYLIEGLLIMTSSSTAPGFKAQIAFSGSLTQEKNLLLSRYGSNASTATLFRPDNASSATLPRNVATVPGALQGFCEFRFVLFATGAGTFNVMLAQNTADAAAISLRASSHILIRKLQ